MVNEQRVRRIKNLIYAFFVVLFFLPAVLVIALFFKVMSLESSMQEALAATPSSQTAPVGQFGLQVDNQSNRPADSALPATSSMAERSSNSEAAPEVSSADTMDTENSGPDTQNAVGQLEQEADSGYGVGQSIAEPSMPLDSSVSGANSQQGGNNAPGNSVPPGDNPKSGGDSVTGQPDYPNTGGPQW